MQQQKYRQSLIFRRYFINATTPHIVTLCRRYQITALRAYAVAALAILLWDYATTVHLEVSQPSLLHRRFTKTVSVPQNLEGPLVNCQGLILYCEFTIEPL